MKKIAVILLMAIAGYSLGGNDSPPPQNLLDYRTELVAMIARGNYVAFDFNQPAGDTVYWGWGHAGKKTELHYYVSGEKVTVEVFECYFYAKFGITLEQYFFREAVKRGLAKLKPEAV